MSDDGNIPNVKAPPVETNGELAALRDEVRQLRDEVRVLSAIIRQASTRINHVVELQTPPGAEEYARALKERDDYRLIAQDLHLRLYPVDITDFKSEEMVPRPAGTPGPLDRFIAERKGTK